MRCVVPHYRDGVRKGIFPLGSIWVYVFYLCYMLLSSG